MKAIDKILLVSIVIGVWITATIEIIWVWYAKQLGELM
jgi:hypothetical protein